MMRPMTSVRRPSSAVIEPVPVARHAMPSMKNPRMFTTSMTPLVPARICESQSMIGDRTDAIGHDVGGLDAEVLPSTQLFRHGAPPSRRSVVAP